MQQRTVRAVLAACVLAIFLAVVIAAAAESPARPAVRVARVVAPAVTVVPSSTLGLPVTPLPVVQDSVVPAPEAPVVEAPAAAERPDPAPVAVTIHESSNDGVFPAQSWWDAIQTCEGGGPGQWRTGYFGLEANEPIGWMSYGDQLAWARRIFAEHGPSAWGCWLNGTVGGPW